MTLWIEEDRGYDSPCYIWQGARNGRYGWVNSPKRTTAHRFLWMEEHGLLPADHHVHHLCHEPLCVRLDHLKAMTNSEHRRLHPESGRPNRLSKAQVDDIRTSALSLRDISLKYGISRSYASKVRQGLFPQEFRVSKNQLPSRAPTPQRSWNKGGTRLSMTAIDDIRSSELSLRKIAAKYGITATYASLIRRRKVLADR